MKRHYFLSLLCSITFCSCGNDDSNIINGEPSEKPECTQDSECDSGSCLSSGKCAKIVDKGEKCSKKAICAEGLECIDGICQNPPECTKDTECPSGKCLSDGKCASLVDKGEKCSDEAVCKSGLDCIEGICREPEIGGCTKDDDCANNTDGHTICLPSGVCGAVHPKGEQCGSELELCDTDLECVDNVCIQRADHGDYCSSYDWVLCSENLHCIDELCLTDEEANDPGPNPESEPVTDDSDILTGVTLPENKTLDDPCLKCSLNQHCLNGTCKDGRGIYAFIANTITDENGGKVRVKVALDPYPDSDVKFKCWIISDSPYPEAKVDCSNITIPKGDVVNNPLHNITNGYEFDVTGIPDQIDDGTKVFYLMIQAVSESPTYKDIIKTPIPMMNLNVDKAGVVIKADNNLMTGENGETASYTLALQSKPVAPVRLKLFSSDLTEGTVEPHVLDFTPENWNTPQTVTVTGVDDKNRDGAQYYWISTKTVSFDPKYNDIDVRDVFLTNADNDKIGVSLACNDYKLTLSASSTNVSVVLNAKPDKNVKVHLDNSMPALLEIPQNEVEFTPDNWNVPQNIGVSVSKFDETTQAITNVCVFAYIESEDDYNFDTRSKTWCFDIYRHEPLEFPYTGKEQKVTLLPGEYDIEVWGSQGEGSQNGIGGYGGYSHGKYILKEKKDLYINSGGNEITTAVEGDIFQEQWGKTKAALTTYNGGGSGSGNGGGATHIATVSGELKTLSEQRDNVLIVAGGGGSGRFAYGGFGGGEKGGDGELTADRCDKSPTGGTQDKGGIKGHSQASGNGTDGDFGKGGSGVGEYSFLNTSSPHYDGGGGGGAGWFGGGGVPYGCGGGGGSGHISSEITDGEILDGSGKHEFPSPIEGTEFGHAGTGHARITIIEKPPAIVN